MNQLLFILLLAALPSPAFLALLLMGWFDSKITPNPYLRMQANFECVFGLFFAALLLPGVLVAARGGPFLLFDAFWIVAALFVYSVNCLLLSIPAMLGRHSASKALYFLAWFKLLLPCVGWFFAYFAIRYYWLGMKQVRDGTYATPQPQTPPERC
ncbi:hypothetical protein OT109_11050 [Phycisphaeraceae bacterium D3-23]